jgi:6,7-dimethyl-8-ribityllumazine synthase
MTSTNETEFDPASEVELAELVGTYLTPSEEGRGVRIGLACGRFNGGITTRLLSGALTALAERGVERRDITLGWAPGAFELPLLAKAMITSGRVDAVIALGAVIRGDTGHYDVVAGECARGVQDVQLHTGTPVVFGVLTTNTVDQALERSMPDATNKGRESALTALEMVNIVSRGPLAAK